jgi:hypothetical protein
MPRSHERRVWRNRRELHQKSDNSIAFTMVLRHSHSWGWGGRCYHKPAKSRFRLIRIRHGLLEIDYGIEHVAVGMSYKTYSRCDSLCAYNCTAK